MASHVDYRETIIMGCATKQMSCARTKRKCADVRDAAGGNRLLGWKGDSFICDAIDGAQTRVKVIKVK